MNGPLPGLLVFTKIPGRAPCKTRLLGGPLSEKQVELLAKAFLSDTLKTALAASSKLLVASQPLVSAEELYLLLQALPNCVPLEVLTRIQLFDQVGERFNVRLQNAAEYGLINSGRGVVIIGSDSPSLQSKTIENALEEVAKGKLVVGPTPNGGIYLIGLPAELIEEKLLIKIPWGARSEIKEVRKLIDGTADLLLLDPLPDIDTAADLKELVSEMHSLKPGATANLLRKLEPLLSLT